MRRKASPGNQSLRHSKQPAEEPEGEPAEDPRRQVSEEPEVKVRMREALNRTRVWCLKVSKGYGKLMLMTLEQELTTAQANFDSQRGDVAKAAAELISNIGPALVQFAKGEMKEVAIKYHEATSHLKTTNKLSDFQVEVRRAINGLPAAVETILSEDDVLVYTFNAGEGALQRFGMTGQEKDLIRAACNLALKQVQAIVKSNYPSNVHDMQMQRSGVLDFPKEFQEAISDNYQIYRAARVKLEDRANDLDKAKVAVSKSAAQDDFADF